MSTIVTASEAREWHTDTVTVYELNDLLARVRALGGTITNSRPCGDGYTITYVA